MFLINRYASPDVIAPGWRPINLLVAVEFAMLTVELMRDGNLHGHDGRSVSRPVGHLLTGGYVIPAALLLLIAWLAFSRLPWVADYGVSIVGIALDLLIVGLTMGTGSVELFAGIAVLYIAFSVMVSAFLRGPLRTTILIVAFIFIAGQLTPIALPFIR